MNLVVAVAVAVLFGAGVQLMTCKDLTKLVGGTLLVTNAAILLLVSAGFLTRVEPPPGAEGAGLLADPLVQALALTAVVINFATTVLLLRVMAAVESTHEALTTDDLAAGELRDEARAGRKGAES